MFIIYRQAEKEEVKTDVLFRVQYGTTPSSSSSTTSSTNEIKPILVTPHHQQANQNVLHNQIGYHTPPSRSSTQKTTKTPSHYAHKFALVKSSQNLQDFSGDHVAGNFVTPTTLQQQKVQKAERHHRQRYIASTTPSSLIPNHGSPARKMLPTYDPRQNIIKKYGILKIYKIWLL